MLCENKARAGPFGGVVPIQMASSQTPAVSRRALAVAIEAESRALRAPRLRVKTRGSADDSGEENEEDKEEEEDEK